MDNKSALRIEHVDRIRDAIRERAPADQQKLYLTPYTLVIALEAIGLIERDP